MILNLREKKIKRDPGDWEVVWKLDLDGFFSN